MSLYTIHESCGVMSCGFLMPFVLSKTHTLSSRRAVYYDLQNNYHTARLEWIVIWLIVVEVVVGLFECLSMAGWVGKE